jgi:4-hydroxy-tetrahydrodipicolinate synthase
MIECGRDGDLTEGREHAETLLPLVLALFAEPSPAVIKAALHHQGRIATPDVRMPMSAASPSAVDRVRAAHVTRTGPRAEAGGPARCHAAS